jgi:hypothetical protein
MRAFVTLHSNAVSTALAGGGLPTCGDNAINVAGEECDGTDLGGQTCASLGFSGGTLACSSCSFDTSDCSTGGGLPETGQTQCDQGAGTLGPCPGSPAGQDGSLRPGVTRTGSLTDNGNGTVSDSITGLMWEKLDDNNSDALHDYNTAFTWYNAFKKIRVLNGDNTGCIASGLPAACCSGSGVGTCTPFLGFTDWRLPSVTELQSIVNYGAVSPTAYSEFNSSCAGGCTTTGTPCSCTQSNYYWSSTTYQGITSNAWLVSFSTGTVGAFPKSNNLYVRAVRGGL